MLDTCLCQIHFNIFKTTHSLLGHQITIQGYTLLCCVVWMAIAFIINKWGKLELLALGFHTWLWSRENVRGGDAGTADSFKQIACSNWWGEIRSPSMASLKCMVTDLKAWTELRSKVGSNPLLSGMFHEGVLMLGNEWYEAFKHTFGATKARDFGFKGMMACRNNKLQKETCEGFQWAILKQTL